MSNLPESGALERSLILLDQGRYELAEAEIRKAIAQNPESAFSHALLGICLTHLNQLSAAQRAAEKAIQLSPEEFYGYYALTQVLLQARQFLKAEQAIQKALRLSPRDVDFLALLASIYGEQKRWAKALAIAQHGLRLDPLHRDCLNNAVLALLQLNRYREAESLSRQSLRNYPSDAFSQTLLGWTQLFRAQAKPPQQAVQTFREALRLNPLNEAAQIGLVEAIKSNYWPYRILSGRFGRVYLGLGILGLFQLALLSSHWVGGTTLPIAIMGLGILLIISVDPIALLFLRFHALGRLAMSPTQRWAAHWFLGAMLVTIGAIGGYFATRDGSFFLEALVSGSLAITLSQVAAITAPAFRRLMQRLAIVLAVSGTLSSIGSGIFFAPVAAALPATLKESMLLVATISLLIWVVSLFAYVMLLRSEQFYTALKAIWDNDSRPIRTQVKIVYASYFIVTAIIWLVVFKGAFERGALFLSGLMILGPFISLSGILNWDVTFRSGLPAWIDIKFGRTSARWFCGVAGIMFTGWFFWLLLHIYPSVPAHQ